MSKIGILIVDDESLLCESLRILLSRRLNLDINIAFDGNSALDLFRKKRHNIVLSDYRMPNGDGFFLLHEIMKIEPETKFIIMTGYGDIQLKHEVLKEGAIGFFEKPIDSNQLLKMINELITSISHRQQNELYKMVKLNSYAKKAPSVFISYAHENDGYQDAIEDLAIYLRNKGIPVVTDRLYKNRPPEKGWQIWMQDQIEESDIVLIACTESYYRRWRKKEDPKKGKGVTFEGAIITQELYDASFKNNKFYPILPDGGGEEHIPTPLRAFSNMLFFPSNNQGIFNLIAAEFTDPNLSLPPFSTLKESDELHKQVDEFNSHMVPANTDYMFELKDEKPNSVQGIARQSISLPKIIYSDSVEIAMNAFHLKKEDINDLLLRELRSHPLYVKLDYESLPVQLKNGYFLTLSKLGDNITIENATRVPINLNIQETWSKLTAQYFIAYRLSFRQDHMVLSDKIRYEETRKEIDNLYSLVQKYMVATKIASSPKLHLLFHESKRLVDKALSFADIHYYKYLNADKTADHLGQTAIQLDSVISIVHKIITEHIPPT